MLGIVVLGESLQWNQPAGAIVVLTGVALVQGFLRPFRERPSTQGRPTTPESRPAG
jgi:drug/metabolite transporter (DMT)-like permease